MKDTKYYSFTDILVIIPFNMHLFFLYHVFLPSTEENRHYEYDGDHPLQQLVVCQLQFVSGLHSVGQTHSRIQKGIVSHENIALNHRKQYYDNFYWKEWIKTQFSRMVLK